MIVGYRMPETTCAYCKKRIHKTDTQIKNSRMQFCCREHFMQYKREHKNYVCRQDTTALKKIKWLASIKDRAK